MEERLRGALSKWGEKGRDNSRTNHRLTNGYRRTNRVIVSTGTAQSIVRQY